MKIYFFDIMKNGQIFPSKVCDFQYDNKFPFSRKMENIKGSKEVRLLKLRKRGYQDSIHFEIFQVA